MIELASRRVHVVGVTPYPDERFVLQAIRSLTDPVDGVLPPGSVLVCDRDRKWSGAVRECLRAVGVQVVQTPVRAPNCNAYAERFVRSIKHECVDRVIPLGEGHFRHTIREYLAHSHGERNHQGLGNELLVCPGPSRSSGPVRKCQRIGGILNYYHRAA